MVVITRRMQSKKKVRTQPPESFKNEAMGLAEKVGVAQTAAHLRLHDSQLYDWQQKARLRHSQYEVE